MRKTWLLVMMLTVVLCACVVLSACEPSKDDYVGTYIDGPLVTDWIKLEENTWSDSSGLSGRLEYSDGVIHCYWNAFGERELFYGTVKKGVFTYTLGETSTDGTLIYYYAYADTKHEAQ